MDAAIFPARQIDPTRSILHYQGNSQQSQSNIFLGPDFHDKCTQIKVESTEIVKESNGEIGKTSSCVGFDLRDKFDGSYRNCSWIQNSSECTVKDFEVGVKTGGICLNLGSNISWECKKCRPRTPFSNLVDFVCHTIKAHQGSLHFKCNVCSEVCEDPTLLAKHFSDHSKIDVSLSHAASCEESAAEEHPQCDNTNHNFSDSDSEPLVIKASPQFLDTRKKKLKADPPLISKGTRYNKHKKNVNKVILLHKSEKKVKAGLCDSCGKCYKGTFWKHNLKCHINSCIQTSTINGDELVKRRDRRKKHVKTTKGYLCSYCGKTFNKSCSLQTHYRVHTGEKPYNCSECGKNFSNRPNLKRHLLIHSGEKPYLCTLCGKAFNHPWTFKTHSYTHAGPRSVRLKDNTYACEFCDKKFESRSPLEVHIRVHTKERPYQCSYCTKRFSQKSSLKQHILNHTGLKPHKCTYCSKSFKYLVCLKTHIRTHTGERPYKCSVCEKAFSSQSNLYRHRATHSGLKRFKCDYCGKEFGQRSALGDHINIHTGARPYSCPHCSSCFANQSTLSKHVSKHTVKLGLR